MSLSAFPMRIISGRHVMCRECRSGLAGLCVHSSFIQGAARGNSRSGF